MISRRNFILGSLLGALSLPTSAGTTGDSLGEFIQQNSIGNIQQEVKSKVDALIHVKKEGDGLFYLTYTEDGKEKMKTIVSPGKPQWDAKKKRMRGQYTTTGVFDIKTKERMHRSSLYDNAKMPFAMHFHGHLFFHEGKVNGLPLSHGCIRLPQRKAEELFRMVKLGTKVIIEGTGG